MLTPLGNSIIVLYFSLEYSPYSEVIPVLSDFKNLNVLMSATLALSSSDISLSISSSKLFINLISDSPSKFISLKDLVAIISKLASS